MLKIKGILEHNLFMHHLSAFKQEYLMIGLIRFPKGNAICIFYFYTTSYLLRKYFACYIETIHALTFRN